MNSRNHYPDLHGEAVRVIRFKAGQLSRLPCFTRADVEDLEQELAMDLLRRLPWFDPSRAGLATFLDRIVGHRAANLVAGAMAKRRGGGLTLVSVDDLESGDDQETTLDSPNQERVELGVEVRRLLGRLPEEHRHLCHLLMAVDKPEIPRRLGVSRATFYRRLAEVRGFFRDAGLEEIAMAA
ncbi:MAG: sigma-70 family RNA polymerase sigma factor [Magnetococcales bacterium]|nr:sigma-70 family RNA polymerase sigma factor [Magnetococcales bacterium]